jgi:DNA polymerase-3 subunit gamma/tau
MSYLVLARKYRPQIFADVIGQAHITDLLAKAILSGRIAHAYLFCGPRGIGKTSCARILAKSLNCEKGPTLQPCGQCTACCEIAKGSGFDVLEIDGASNRGIDEIRALRENVKFAPGYGRYKIYIVDEVHMLTAEAFNALLKTLEEPPAHVKFILATTAPHKVPATIISRCQRFDFKRISVEIIVNAMAAISRSENWEVEPDALYAIAKAADGSLRDALSILDQLGALSGEGVKAGDVFAMLGLVETDLLFELTEALGSKDCSNALEVLAKIMDKGKDVRQLNKDMIEHFRNLMVIKVGGKALGRLVDYPVAIKEMYLAQCQRFSLKEILEAIDILIDAQETARITETNRTPLEVAFAKITYRLEFLGGRTSSALGGHADTKVTLSAEQGSLPTVSMPTEEPRQAAGSSSAAILKNNKGEVVISSDDVAEAMPEVSGADVLGGTQTLANSPLPHLCNKEGARGSSLSAETVRIKEHGDPVRVDALDIEKIKRCWDTLTHAVSREKMSVATYLQEGSPIVFKDSKLVVGFPKKCAFQREALEDKGNIQIVERIFSEKLGVAVIVRYEIVDAYEPQEEETLVKKTLETFQGKVVSRWHNE